MKFNWKLIFIFACIHLSAGISIGFCLGASLGRYPELIEQSVSLATFTAMMINTVIFFFFSRKLKAPTSNATLIQGFLVILIGALITLPLNWLISESLNLESLLVQYVFTIAAMITGISIGFRAPVKNQP